MLQSTVEDTTEPSGRVALMRSVYSDGFCRRSSGTYTSKDCTVSLGLLLYSSDKFRSFQLQLNCSFKAFFLVDCECFRLHFIHTSLDRDSCSGARTDASATHFLVLSHVVFGRSSTDSRVHSFDVVQPHHSSSSSLACPVIWGRRYS